MRAGGIFGSATSFASFLCGRRSLTARSRSRDSTRWAYRMLSGLSPRACMVNPHGDFAVSNAADGPAAELGLDSHAPGGATVGSRGQLEVALACGEHLPQGIQGESAPAGVDPLATRLLSLHLSLEGDGVAAGAEGPRPRLAAGVARWGGGHGIALSA
jgi:hypothetical protein